jgi:hypothetical protein
MIEPIVYWVITILSIAMPLLSLALIASARRTTRLTWWLRVSIGILLMAFCYQACVWAIYSLYLKYVFVVLAAGFITWAWISRGARGNVRFGWQIFSFIIIAALFIGNGLLLRGHMPPKDQALGLPFPLRGGNYYVIQGGNSPVANFFHNRSRSQKYALDIVKLNSNGARANGLLPKSLDRYEIYGDTVFSPCDGTVITAVDGRPESVPPSMIADHPLGNGVIIDMGEDRLIVLAHMKPGSIMVSDRQEIKAGDPLGQVGNSGRSAEPHLHIMAVKRSHTDEVFRGEPLPMTFNNRFLTLNDIVRN